MAQLCEVLSFKSSIQSWKVATLESVADYSHRPQPWLRGSRRPDLLLLGSV